MGPWSGNPLDRHARARVGDSLHVRRMGAGRLRTTSHLRAARLQERPEILTGEGIAMNRDFMFTSESVTEGHPDKIADQISDAVLDEILRQDPKGRVACETLVKTGMAVIAGEITTTCYADMPTIVRNTIKSIGYCSSD